MANADSVAPSQEVVASGRCEFDWKLARFNFKVWISRRAPVRWLSASCANRAILSSPMFSWSGRSSKMVKKASSFGVA